MLKTLEEKVDPKHAALLIVDMQNDFCHSEGAGAKNGSNVGPVQAIVPTLQGLIDDARSVDMPVIFIRAVHNDWTDSEVRLERRRGRAVPNCREGTWGIEWYGVAPVTGEAIVTKHRFSAFINTDLDLILRAQGIKTIIMTGTATNVCIESTARDGFMMDYYVVLAKDCCASSDLELHEGTLKNISRGFGVVHAAAEIAAAARVGVRELVTA
jgi:ureidoacrylate peracid hydrolase